MLPKSHLTKKNHLHIFVVWAPMNHVRLTIVRLNKSDERETMLTLDNSANAPLPIAAKPTKAKQLTRLSCLRLYEKILRLMIKTTQFPSFVRCHEHVICPIIGFVRVFHCVIMWVKPFKQAAYIWYNALYQCLAYLLHVYNFVPKYAPAWLTQYHLNKAQQLKQDCKRCYPGNIIDA